MRFLLQEVLDLENCYFTVEEDQEEKGLIDVVSVGATEKFKIDRVDVVIV